MPSKKSFFNRTLFRKNMSRFWPLWGGASLVGSLLPLYMLMALLSGAARHLDALEFSYALYMTAAAVGPGLCAVYAIACATLVWSYLYNSRAVGLMHTLPVDRTCLFVTNTLSGMAMMLIPFAVVGGFLCLTALLWGFLDLVSAAATALAILLMAVAFFGLATFCAMLTGNAFALPVIYALANFLAPLLEQLAAGLASAFLTGSPGGQGTFNFLSPVIQMYQSISVKVIRDSAGEVEAHYLGGFGVLAAYGLAGAALLGLAWLLYRRRASEQAGDVAAFRVLRPIFRYGLALLSALTVGRMVYELLWGALFQPGIYAQFVPMAVCMALAGVLGYYVASMLLEKTPRVFRGSARGVALACALTVALCAMVRLDVLGVERRVPALEDVEWVQMGGTGRALSYDTETQPDLAARLVEAHQAIVDDREYLRQPCDSRDNYRFFTFTYKLKNGSILTRSYHLWFEEDRVADPGTFDGKLAALYRDPEIIASQIVIPEDATLSDVMVYSSHTGYGLESLAPQDCQRIYEALLQDAREGNIPGEDVLRWDPSYDFYVHIEYRRLDQRGSFEHGYNTAYLYPSMERTIAVLLDLELVTQAELELWNEELAAGMEK